MPADDRSPSSTAARPPAPGHRPARERRAAHVDEESRRPSSGHDPARHGAARAGEGRACAARRDGEPRNAGRRRSAERRKSEGQKRPQGPRRGVSERRQEGDCRDESEQPERPQGGADPCPRGGCSMASGYGSRRALVRPCRPGAPPPERRRRGSEPARPPRRRTSTGAGGDRPMRSGGVAAVGLSPRNGWTKDGPGDTIGFTSRKAWRRR